jgi:hypothetical protein
MVQEMHNCDARTYELQTLYWLGINKLFHPGAHTPQRRHVAEGNTHLVSLQVLDAAARLQGQLRVALLQVQNGEACEAELPMGTPSWGARVQPAVAASPVMCCTRARVPRFLPAWLRGWDGMGPSSDNASREGQAAAAGARLAAVYDWLGAVACGIGAHTCNHSLLLASCTCALREA